MQTATKSSPRDSRFPVNFVLSGIDKMAEENILAPTRSDDQLVLVKARLPYVKSNLLLDLQKPQNNPIFRISMDILQNTNFFRAFTASANVPSIYIQQFWNTLTQEAKSGVYSFQLDKQWFPLNADLFREALEITPMHVNNLFQPWRVMLTLINQCLTGKTSRSDKPRHPILQMLWGIVTRSNVDYAKLLWEEFVQGIQTFFSHRASLNIPSKKSTPHVIPYCRFTKLIIYYLGSRHNIHRRSESPIHVTGDDFPIGNLKFVPKDMVARKPTAKRDEQKKTASAADKPKNPTPVKKPATAKQTKHVTEKSTKPSPVKKAGKAETIRQLPVVDGKGKGIATDEQAALSLLDLHNPKKKTTTDQYVFQRRTPAAEDAPIRPSTQPEDDTSANIVHDTPSPTDAETSADTYKTNNEGDTEILNIGEE
ncbi:hypothetical protein Tco_0267597 [Tanacetum coccineum]